MVAASDDESAFKAVFEERLLALRAEQTLAMCDLQGRLAKVEDLEDRVSKIEERLSMAPATEAVQAAPSTVSSVLHEPSVSNLQCEQKPARKIRKTRTEAFNDMEADADHEAAALYRFSLSMWDAAILLAFRRVTFSDKVLIWCGVVVNYIMQITLLLVVSLNMAGQSAFDDQRVQYLMQWRVLTGHSHAQVDAISGEALIQRLCSRSLWSFEQAEFDEMWEYLYQPMPGWSLSILAIVLWVLNVSVEFRDIYEQALAMLNLELVSKHDSGLVRVEDHLEVVGIRHINKVLIAVFIIIPRTGISLGLAFFGCWYLAETVSLHDIVLNALALAFIMEVDELLAQVLLPRKLQDVIDHVQPITCGTPFKIGAFHRAGLMRYVLMVAMITFSLVYWLWPFHLHVVAASMALCAGDQAFTQFGGVAEMPTVVLVDNSDYVRECDKDHLMKDYIPRFYLGERPPVKKQIVDLEGDDRLKESLLYAFSGCPSGTVWVHMDGQDEGECKTVNEYLMSNLPADVTVGGNYAIPKCKRFEPDLLNGTCRDPGHVRSCTWTWQSYQCEGAPPGNLAKEACADVTDVEELELSCNVWENNFKMPHPTANCLIVDSCKKKEGTNCMYMAGTLALTIGSVIRYGNNGTNDTALLAAINFGLSRALQVSPSNVTVIQIRGSDNNWDGLSRLSSGSQLSPGPGVVAAGTEVSDFITSSWPVADAAIDDFGISQIKFLVAMPATLAPHTIPKRAKKVMDFMNFQLGNGTVTYANFTPWPAHFTTEPSLIIDSMLPLEFRQGQPPNVCTCQEQSGGIQVGLQGRGNASSSSGSGRGRGGGFPAPGGGSPLGGGGR